MGTSTKKESKRKLDNEAKSDEDKWPKVCK